MGWLGRTIILVILTLFIIPNIYAATYYISPSGSDSNSGTSQGSPVQKFSRAFSLMNGGDTLILLDGVYGGSNTGEIGSTDIPSGPNRNSMTTIRSLNGAGAVRYSKTMVVGDSNERIENAMIQGILFSTDTNSGGGLSIENGEYIYIKDSGMRNFEEGWDGGFGIGSNNHPQPNKHILIEDSWIWGRGKTAGITFCSERIVWRRVVMRHEGCTRNDNSCDPTQTFSANYNSRWVSVQNVVMFDTITRGGRDVGGTTIAMQSSACHDDVAEDRTGYTDILGGIAYNTYDGGYIADISNIGGVLEPTLDVENTAVWKMNRVGGGGSFSSYVNGPTGGGEMHVRNSVAGPSDGDGFDMHDLSDLSVRNSIGYDLTATGYDTNFDGPTPVNSLAYNIEFDDGCSGDCHTSNPLVAQPGYSNPCLKYPWRVEEDSICEGAGDDGSDIGANVVGYGGDGLFYGDPGFDAQGDFSDLWPWPNEELMKEQICADDVQGRGWCDDYVSPSNPGKTFTEYIWEDPLGNDCPPEICDPVPVPCNQRPGYGEACEVGVGACYATGTLSCNNNNDMEERPSCNAVEGTPTTETCNSIDDDCDGIVDNGFDQDGDGYYALTCPGGNDCNDNDQTINPGAPEICSDGQDSNCNGNGDETEGNGCLTAAAGMIGYYPFEGNAVDMSGTGNDGTVSGATLTTGHDGQAYNFDGSNDYINLGNDASLQNLAEFTYAAWIYPTDDGTKNILSKNQNRKELRIQGTGSSTHLRGCVRSGGSNYCSQSSSGSITLNQWHHVAVTYNDNTNRQPTLYINGVEVTYSNQPTASGTLNTDDGQDLNIGRRTNNNDRYFQGTIDDVRIYNRALSAGEIASIGAPTPTCNDGIQNQDETGVDCGGSCPACPPPPVCGNNLLESGEQCDDGNTQPGDGCDGSCQLEIVQGDCSAANILCVGGPESEYNTIQQASNNAGPGDTVQVYDGTYNGFEVGSSGTSSQPVTFKAVGDNVRITTESPAGEGGIFISNKDHIVIEGFDIDGTDSRCIAARDASATSPMTEITVRNNQCDNAQQEGFYLSNAQYVLAEGNTITNSGGHSIYLANAGADDAIIRNNIIDGSQLAGVHMNGDATIGGDGMIDRVLIEGNIITNTLGNGGTSKPLSLDGVQDSTISNNLFYNWDASAAIRGFEADGTTGPKNLIIKANTFIIPSGKNAIKLTDDEGGHTIFNNILAKEGSSTPIDIQSNNYQESNNLETSVGALLFTNPGNRDYHLTASSPAIDAGVASFNGESAPTVDLDGNSRPAGAAHDIGAYEYGSTGGPTCSDGIQNQGEAGVDCGGPCPACAPTCSDGIQNGGETGVDCGGSCPACPSCTDGIQNQGETGVDCGGPCAACPPTPPPAGLVAYYPFDTGAQDAHGGNHGTNNGATIITDPQRGAVYSFDGTDDYISLPNFPTSFTDFTYAAWIKINGGSDWERLFDFNDGTAPTATSGAYTYFSATSGLGTALFAITQGGYQAGDEAQGSTHTTGTWIHVAVTQNGNQITTYKNGAQDSTTTTARRINQLGLTNFWLGRSAYSTNPYFDGLMDNVQFYNRALTPGEITITMTAEPGDAQTCQELSGNLCSTNEICSGTNLGASDGVCCDIACDCANTGDLNCDNTVNIFDLVRAANPRIRPTNWIDQLLDVFNNFGMNY